MLEDLRRFNSIGDNAGIDFFLNQILEDSPIDIDSLKELCNLEKNIKLTFEAAIIFFEYLKIITEKDKKFYLAENAIKIKKSDNIPKTLCSICLKQITTDNILDLEAVYYSHENNLYKIKKGGFSFKYSLLRNILIQYKVITEEKGEYILNSDYEIIFSECKKAQQYTRTLEQLKKQLQEKEIQGEISEQFVLDYEKRRLESTDKEKKIKRISIIDVSAGFDILSFNNDQSSDYDRFIEVKSYVGGEHFYWSENEIEKAKLYEEKYYIYLVNFNELNIPGYKPVIINNPYRNIFMDDSWVKTPTSYFIKHIQN